MFSSTPTSLGSRYTHDDIEYDNDSIFLNSNSNKCNDNNDTFSVDDTNTEEFRTPLNTC